jgi:hypothetical protein
MKFKSNNVNNVSPVCIDDILEDMEGVMSMDLEEAVEHLDDLEILYNNIEKFGITEPVMHLVGGTLESMGVSITEKAACLEGLKEGLKEAGKRVWEVIVKIFTKIIELITGDKAEALHKRCEQLLKEPDVRIVAEHAAVIGDLGGILYKDDVAGIKEVILGWTDFQHIDKYLSRYDSVVKYGSGDEIVYDSDVENALKVPPLKAAMTFGSTHAILKHADVALIGIRGLEQYSKTCLKAAKMFLNQLDHGASKAKAGELQLSARATNMIVLLLFKDVTNKLKVVDAINKFEKSNDESK